jgi:hypothetical protein
VGAAREAAERDELDAWVALFLASPGKDNAALAHRLSEPPRCWLGPALLPVDQLHRLAGPPDAPVPWPVDEDYWRDDVKEMAKRIEIGGSPAGDCLPPRRPAGTGGRRPPGRGPRRAGKDHAWAVIAFEDPEEHDRFVAPCLA